jgi:hypothetical protein
MHTPANKSVLYLAILALVAAVLVGVNSIVYANHVAQQSNRNWCALVSNLDDAYRQNPPTSPVGRQIAADMHNLRVRLGCP